ncbi:MAG: 50S ribosomal protein L25 [Peptococcaceae bacterium]|nr:50S ribosomal protein L25 [Peptococcaceae bacterium]
MSILKGEVRSLNRKAKHLRNEGIIPGVLYGKNLDQSISLQFPQKEVLTFLKSNSKGSIVELQVGEEKYKALFKEVTYAPVTGNIEHLNFQTLVEGEKITNTAAVVLINREEVKEGVIQQTLSEISYRALPSQLIEKIEIDVKDLKPGDSIFVSDLDIAKDEAYEIRNPLDSLIVSVLEPKTTVVEDVEEPEESEGGNQEQS